jgi:hypothetical protein
MGSIKERLRDRALHRRLQKQRARKEVKAWEAAGRPIPPPQSYKHQVIRRIASRHQATILVETGTLAGGTLVACLDDFERLFSIELSEALYAAASERLAFTQKVQLYLGDSATELPKILRGLNCPAVFWLDAHYSGDGTARAEIDTPIENELKLIASHNVTKHIIAIDDIRHFDGTDGYPTFIELTNLSNELWPNHRLSVDLDILTIEPK